MNVFSKNCNAMVQMSQRNLLQPIMWLFFSNLLCDNVNCHSLASYLDDSLCYVDNSYDHKYT